MKVNEFLNNINKKFSYKGSSELIVFTIGLGFILVAVLGLVIDIREEYIISYSIAAFLFIYSEIFTVGKTNIIFNILYYLLIMATVLFIIVGPVFFEANPKITNNIYDKLSILSLAGFGISIVLFAAKILEEKNG